DLIGTGPFMLKEWVVNDHFTAVKNPSYWKKDKDGTQLPYLNSITFKPVPDGQARLNGLQSGQFQAINTGSALDVEQIRALEQAGMKIDTYTVEQTQYISKAIARDFEAYFWDNFPGTGGDTLFVWWHCNTPATPCDNLVNFGGFNDAQINSDLDKGRAELDAA